MKKLLILFLSISALVITQIPAEAGHLSFGIPLPFPFLFYNFCSQPGYEKGYTKDYYYYRPSSPDPWCYRRDWSDPRACQPVVIPGV